QGSVLGPLLFSVFINDLPGVLHHSDHMIFADDTQIFLKCRVSELDIAIAKVTSDITRFCQWANSNDLVLNFEKTKALLVGSAFYLNTFNTDSITPIVINNSVIPWVKSVRNLGLVFDGTLSWKYHLIHMSNKVFSTLRQLRNNRAQLPTDVRQTLVSSLILPYFDYCCAVYNDINVTQKIRVERMFNAGIRFIFDLRRDEHITP
ncbi:hypothetical protein DD595_24960, partial [Enterobacter cloacae complex sp. 4DZ3-17B2]|uniref:reverse transcriptase domain-containing protein n=1 Tax=Enterobacter cloacae complex sp. 4DZ3-17B2 TaxID=2511990 RepID=UPI0010105704